MSNIADSHRQSAEPASGPGTASLTLAAISSPHGKSAAAIVVAVVTLGVAFALIIRIYRQYKTLDEPLLLERMK